MANPTLTTGTVTPRLLTLEQLSAAGTKPGCRQTKRFRELFGEEVEVTPERCIEHADEFDFDLAAEHLLSPPALDAYERVRAAAAAEYERVRAAAWAEYERVRAAAFAEYLRHLRVRAAALAEYERVTAAAWAEYKRVTAPAWAEYRRGRAAAFGRLYCGRGRGVMAEPISTRDWLALLVAFAGQVGGLAALLAAYG